MKNFKKGDRVKTIYGSIETVSRVEGCQVFTYESKNSWWHPTKVYKI